MKAILAFLLLLTGCGAPAPQPDLQARTVDGVTVFERRLDGPDRLVVQDAIEWRGRFAVESNCLVLTIDGEKLTPVFGNPPALQAAIGGIRSGSSGAAGRSWSIEGSRAAEKDEAAYSKAMGACARRPFLVAALSDPRPSPQP